MYVIDNIHANKTSTFPLNFGKHQFIFNKYMLWLEGLGLHKIHTEIQATQVIRLRVRVLKRSAGKEVLKKKKGMAIEKYFGV